MCLDVCKGGERCGAGYAWPAAAPTGGARAESLVPALQRGGGQAMDCPLPRLSRHFAFIMKMEASLQCASAHPTTPDLF